MLLDSFINTDYKHSYHYKVGLRYEVCLSYNDKSA